MHRGSFAQVALAGAVVETVVTRSDLVGAETLREAASLEGTAAQVTPRCLIEFRQLRKEVVGPEAVEVAEDSSAVFEEANAETAFRVWRVHC